MQTNSLSEFHKDLDFGPHQPWPRSLPCYAWKDQLLTDFGRTSGDVIRLKDDLLTLLTTLYPKLKISEVARLYVALKKLQPNLDLNPWLGNFNLRDSESLNKFFSQLLSTPTSFQNWADEKDLRTNDLTILNCFEKCEEILFSFFQKFSASKSIGVQWLELAGELWLMGKGQAVKESLNAENSEAALKTLRRSRFPIASAKQEHKQTCLNRLPWPKQIQGRYQRSGDKDILEIKIQVSNSLDLQKKLDQLKQIQNQMEDLGL